ncbi:MAG: maleylacetate reductase [Gammaproteobacteria bacterium]|nr:maleylacetate reductase [Gammaproteobacteria bacterium]
MFEFTYRALPWNIVFGVDALGQLPAELDGLDLGRALVLTTPNQADVGRRTRDLLGTRSVGLFDRAMMHVPAETVDGAMRVAGESGADCTVSVGGGSTTGLGKMLALNLDLPNVAIPTTYAGSEMTNIWGTTVDGRKRTGRDDRVVPTLTLYDPVLTLGLPAKVAGPSGLNAMAQAVANLTSGALNPMVADMALAAVRALTESLPNVVKDGDDLSARTQALYGACLAGGAIGTGTTSLHHRLCHTFGGAFRTPHAETHTVLLPHCVAYNAASTTEGTCRLAQAMQVDDPAVGLYELAKQVNAPRALKDIGVLEADLDRAAAIATETPVDNPEPVSRERVRKLLHNAFHGLAPALIR